MKTPTALLPRILVLAILSFAGGSVNATQNINTTLLSKSVVYLYRGDNNGQVYTDQVLGTGFLVRVPLLSDPKHAYLILVTARHVVDPAWNHCPDSQPETIYARYNKKNYDSKIDENGVAYAQIPLSSGGTPTWVHPKEADADVAVILLNGKAVDETADAESIPVSDFATDEEAKQKGATDPVLSVGLLFAYPGVKRNYPVFKFGYISTKPDEAVPCQCVKDGAPSFLKLWLLSINLIPGTSGSPIFFAPEGANGVNFGGGRTMLIGLQSTSYLGADISGMTPVQYIFEALQTLSLRDADFYRGTPQNKPASASPSGAN
jgi:hypothetical protein